MSELKRYKDTVASYYDGQAEGAIPNGTRIYKCNSYEDKGLCLHQDGASGIVIGSGGPIPHLTTHEMVYVYSVLWDIALFIDDKEVPVNIVGSQVTTVPPTAMEGVYSSPQIFHCPPTILIPSHEDDTERIDPDPGGGCPRGDDISCVSATGGCMGFRGTKTVNGKSYTRCVWKYEQINMMKRELVVKIFKDQSKGGNGAFAISTTASDPDEFLRECALELELVSTELVGDLEFTYNALLPQICEVWAKLRGYKADTVYERKILTVGEPQPEVHMTLLNSRTPFPVEEL